MPIGYLTTGEDGRAIDSEFEPDLTPGVRQEFDDPAYLGLTPAALLAFTAWPALDLMTDGAPARLFSVRYKRRDIVSDDWLDEANDINGEEPSVVAVCGFTVIRELPQSRFFGPSGWQVVSLLEALNRLAEKHEWSAARAFDIFRRAFPGSEQEVDDQQAAVMGRIESYLAALGPGRRAGAETAFETGRTLVEEMPYALVYDNDEEWLTAAAEYQWATAAQVLALGDVIPAELLAEVLAPIGAVIDATGRIDLSPLLDGPVDVPPAAQPRPAVVPAAAQELPPAAPESASTSS